MKVLFKGARVINPPTSLDDMRDVLVEDGIIKAIEPSIAESDADQTIHLQAKHWLTPGLVDVHVHFRDPGQSAKETTETGAQAAIHGGFTTVCIMPNTMPRLDSLPMIQYVNEKAQKTGIHIYPIAAVTKGLEGKELTPMGGLVNAGVVGFTDDGHGIASGQIMRLALEYSQMYDVPIVCHAEDDTLFKGGCMHEGVYSTRLGLPGVPPVAESAMVARDIELVRYTGGRVHFAHLSSKESVELVRRAKAEGLNVTAETTPHNLTLTDANVDGYDPDFKMNGPLRAAEHQQALIEGLQDGTIDIIATDHAPHTPEEKAMSFIDAPCGVIGLETSVGVILTNFYHTGKLTATQVVRLMSTRPAEIFKLPAGNLSVGQRADITVIDPERSWVVDPTQFKSRSRNCPFKGQTLTGKAVLTMANGEVLMNDVALAVPQLV